MLTKMTAGTIDSIASQVAGFWGTLVSWHVCEDDNLLVLVERDAGYEVIRADDIGLVRWAYGVEPKRDAQARYARLVAISESAVRWPV